jgi:mRNA-degrading endonuclease RelE of RelBE toxin-antitoxin system
MSFRLRYDKRFLRLLEALPGDVLSVARSKVKALADDPYPPGGAKELDDHPGFYRLWLPRDCRLVYQLIEEEAVVDLLYVGPKSPDLYEKLGLYRRSNPT